MPNTEHRILFLISALGVGGAERQTVSLLNNLHLTRSSCSLAYFQRRETILPQLNRTEIDDLLCLDKSRPVDPAALRRLLSYIHANRFTTVVCVEEYPLLNTMLIRPFFKARIIAILHSSFPHMNTSDKIQHLLSKRLFRSCDKLVFVSRMQMQLRLAGLALPENKCKVIYNGVNTDWFQDELGEESKDALRRRLGISADDFVIGICATLKHWKRHTDLIEAAMRLRQRGVPTKVLAIGDGPTRQATEVFARDRGFGPHLLITGFTDKVKEYLALCRCTALPSSHEAFSMAILESMSMGRPVVATEMGGVREQIDHGVDGFIYPCGDVDKLTQHLMMLRDETLAREMGAKARQRIVTDFSLGRMAASYRTLLEGEG